MRSDCQMGGWGSPHLFGVIVEDTDGAQLRPDAAALRVGGAAVLVRSLSELVSDGDISDRRRPGLHDHITQESRVQQQADHRHDQTQQEHEQQEHQDEIRHGFFSSAETCKMQQQQKKREIYNVDMCIGPAQKSVPRPGHTAGETLWLNTTGKDKRGCSKDVVELRILGRNDLK